MTAPVISAGDLVERLLETTMGVHMGSGYQRFPPPLQVEAAARIRELEAALKPFADAADDLDDNHLDFSPIWETPAAMGIDARHLRRARSSLNQDGGKP